MSEKTTKKKASKKKVTSKKARKRSSKKTVKRAEPEPQPTPPVDNGYLLRHDLPTIYADRAYVSVRQDGMAFISWAAVLGDGLVKEEARIATPVHHLQSLRDMLDNLLAQAEGK